MKGASEEENEFSKVKQPAMSRSRTQNLTLLSKFIALSLKRALQFLRKQIVIFTIYQMLAMGPRPYLVPMG